MSNDDPVPVWANWSGRHTSTGARLHHVRSENDAAAIAARAGAEHTTVRVAGAGHSHMPLVPTDDVIVDLSGLAGVISCDPVADDGAGVAHIWAGTPIHALGRPLHDAGLALANQGDIDRQAIAGAVGTGTHGTGMRLPNLSAGVVGARVALASGDLVDCSPRHESDLWNIARLHLGAAGVVTRLSMRVIPAYRLRERRLIADLDDTMARIDDLARANRHVEFFWYPTKDRAVMKVIDETDDEPEYPLAEEGGRVGWNYEVLPSHRTWPHTEMEYSVPAEAGPACLGAMAELLRRDFPAMGWPVEYRFVAPDDVWLSTAYQRPTVTISLHQSIEEDDGPLFRAAEEIFLSFQGRPHWGKVNYLNGDQLAGCHPRWADWWRVRDELDPGSVFLNDYLMGVRA